jgi:hypothetical protein
VALVRTDISEERIASIIRMKRISGRVRSLLILFTLMMEAIPCSETSVLKNATQLHIPEDIFHSP